MKDKQVKIVQLSTDELNLPDTTHFEPEVLDIEEEDSFEIESVKDTETVYTEDIYKNKIENLENQIKKKPKLYKK
jgi:hypothetical protein